jgi:hypothetical protein
MIPPDKTSITFDPHPDCDCLSNAELQQELSEADESLRVLHKLGEEADPMLEPWFIQRRRLLLAELRRRNGQADPFPLSSPLCVGKAGKQENPHNLPLIPSLDLLGLSLSQSIAQGEPFLGRALEAGSVTYIDRENPRSILGSRLQGIGVSPNFTVWPLWVDPEPPLLGDRSYTDLAASRSLLVFDSLRRFHTKSENAPEEMAIVMGYLRELTKQDNAVLVLHHAGKAEGNVYRGSTEILAGVDVAFSLEREKQQTRVLGAPVPLTLRCIKHRYIEEPVLSLEFAVEGKQMIFRDVTEKRQEEREEGQRERLLEIQGVIQKLEGEYGEPNQTQVLKALKETLDIGKNAALNFLSKGESIYWRSEPRDGSRRYQTLSPFPDPIGVGKEESLGNGWEQVL